VSQAIPQGRQDRPVPLVQEGQEVQEDPEQGQKMKKPARQQP